MPHEAADDSYCDLGVRIFELLQRLPELWVAADPAQKREILQIVHSNSTWGIDGLEVELLEPFATLKVVNDEFSEKVAAGVGEDELRVFWLPEEDVVRTRLVELAGLVLRECA